MNMGLSNFGGLFNNFIVFAKDVAGTVGGYVGNGLIWLLQVEGPQYDNLPYFVVARSLMRLLPILFIPFLVPEGSPSTEGQKSDQSTADGDKPDVTGVRAVETEDSTPLIVRN